MLTLTVAATLAVVAATNLAALLRPRGAVAVALGSYVIGSALVVGGSLALSPADAYRQRWLLALLTVAALGAYVLRRALRTPLPEVVPGSIATLRRLARDRSVAALGVVAGASLLYSLALALLTPPNELDTLSYHLARAVLWIQRSSIGPIGGLLDTRIDEFPANAEILQGFTMLVSGSVRFVGLVQFGALLATMVASYGIARRIGLAVEQAAFGALLLPTLPVVALQSSTGLNDLVVAGYVACAAYFALGRTRADAVGLCLSLALLAGTKVTAVLALPTILAILLVVQRGRRRLLLLVGGGVAWVAGSWWYALNVSSGEAVFGEDTADAGASDGLALIAGRVTRLAVQTLDLPGAAGQDRWLYAVAALAILAVGVVVARGRPGRGIALGAALVALPLVLVPLEDVLRRVHWRGWQALGYERIAALGAGRDPTLASSGWTWYGPVGLALAVVAVFWVARAVRRRELTVVALVLAAAPALWLVEIAVAVAYNEGHGRYAMGGVALATATWGIAHARGQAVVVGVIGASATTLVLALANSTEKPLGLRLLEDTGRPSAWTLPHAYAQQVKPELAMAVQYLDRHARRRSLVAVSEDPGVRAFAFVGYPSLARRIVIVGSLDEAARVGADWAVLETVDGCTPGWERRLVEGGWTVYERQDDASESPPLVCPEVARPRN